MQKKLHLFVPVIIIVSVITFLSISAEESLIPSWIKNTAGFWADNKITDQEFIQALQYLVKEGILVIPSSDNSISNLQKNSSSETWNQVIVFSSSTSKKTETFKISGDKWRFTWSCNAENEYDGVNITIYKLSNDLPVEFLLMQKCPPNEETSYVYKGSGEYYFDIMGANISGWTIMVEEI